MAAWSGAASPAPMPAQEVAVVLAGQTAAPVELTFYDENDHQAGDLAIWRDGSTDPETAAMVKRLFRSRIRITARYNAKEPARKPGRTKLRSSADVWY